MVQFIASTLFPPGSLLTVVRWIDWMRIVDTSWKLPCLVYFPMQVKPKNPPEITPADLVACGMSGTFFSVLSDVKQFFDYNYREVRGISLVIHCAHLFSCMFHFASLHSF